MTNEGGKAVTKRFSFKLGQLQTEVTNNGNKLCAILMEQKTNTGIHFLHNMRQKLFSLKAVVMGSDWYIQILFYHVHNSIALKEEPTSYLKKKIKNRCYQQNKHVYI